MTGKLVYVTPLPGGEVAAQLDQDEATRNRFPTRLSWPVDPELERAIVLSKYEDGDDKKLAAKVVNAAHMIRQNLVEAGFQGVAWGPRDTDAAARRAVAGMDPFKNSLVATLDERQSKIAMKGVKVAR